MEKETPKTIRTFALASFLNDMGSDIIYPVWPLFVTTVLKANMAALGFLDGLGEALVSLSQAASGVLSDKFRKRKVFIWTGYLCGALSRWGYALSSVWTHLIPFRILDRAGKIRSAPRDAYVADLSTESTRGRYFGLLRTMDHLGAGVGILLCILLFRILSMRLLFALAAIPSLASALLILTKIKDKKEARSHIYKGRSLGSLNKNSLLFLVLSGIFSLGAFSYSFLLVSAKEAGIQTTFVPVLYLVFTAAASLAAFPFGKLSDKIGRKRVLLISFSLWTAVCVLFVLSRNHLLIFTAFVIYGAHKGALEPSLRAFVCELGPKEWRATFLGGFQMVTGLCALPASLTAGLLWERAEAVAPFGLALVLTILAGILLLFVKTPVCKA